MNRGNPAPPAAAPRDPGMASGTFGNLVTTMGTPRFTDALLQFLNEVTAAEHVHVFRMVNSCPEVLKAVSLDASGEAERQADYYFSRKLYNVDPWVLEWMEAGSGNPALFHVNRDTDSSGGMRRYYDSMEISDRVMVCGAGTNGILGIAIAKSRHRGSLHGDPTRLELIRDFALPLLLKHSEFCLKRQELCHELLSVSEIEERMRCASDSIARREIEVGARVLRGYSTTGIALDLEIGKETVICYKKRLYEKLGLASFHDLLSWYMHALPGDDDELLLRH